MNGSGTLPYLGDLLTMVISHLLAGMILQVGCPAGSDRFTIVNTNNNQQIWKTNYATFQAAFFVRKFPAFPELPFCRFSKN